MRFFDDPQIGCYLDDIGHRVERTKDGKEIKMVDLTLRVQPFTNALAVSCDPDVCTFLFAMVDGQPKAKLKAVEFKLAIPRQQLAVFLLPATEPEPQSAQVLLEDVEISGPRARTEKGVDGYGLVFYASFGPVSKEQLEYICNWHTQQRFITFTEQQPGLDFAGADEPPTTVTPHRPRSGARAH